MLKLYSIFTKNYGIIYSVSRTCRFYPDIGARCLFLKKSAYHRVYIILKTEFISGRALKKDIVERLSQLSILNTSRTYEILSKGNGIFWDIQGDWINFRSWAKVANSLGVERVDNQVEVAYDDVLHSLARANKIITHSLLALRKGKPTSNEYLYKRTGYSCGTISLQKQDDNLIRISNYERLQDEEHYSPEFMHDKYGFRFKHFNNKYYLQLPSSYHTKYIVIKGDTTAYRINKRMGRAVNTAQFGNFQRLYYCADTFAENNKKASTKKNFNNPVLPLLKVFNGRFNVYIRLFQKELSKSLDGLHKLSLIRLQAVTA